MQLQDAVAASDVVPASAPGQGGSSPRPSPAAVPSDGFAAPLDTVAATLDAIGASSEALAAPWNGHGSPPPAVAAAVEALESPHGVQAPFEAVVSDEYCEVIPYNQSNSQLVDY